MGGAFVAVADDATSRLQQSSGPDAVVPGGVLRPRAGSGSIAVALPIADTPSAPPGASVWTPFTDCNTARGKKRLPVCRSFRTSIPAVAGHRQLPSSWRSTGCSDRRRAPSSTACHRPNSWQSTPEFVVCPTGASHSASRTRLSVTPDGRFRGTRTMACCLVTASIARRRRTSSSSSTSTVTVSPARSMSPIGFRLALPFNTSALKSPRETSSTGRATSGSICRPTSATAIWSSRAPSMEPTAPLPSISVPC